MAEDVVDGLEAIQVQTENRQRVIVVGASGQRLPQMAVEGAAIDKIGQRVVMREVFDHPFRILARREIAHEDHVTLFALVFDRSAEPFDRHVASRRMEQLALARLPRHAAARIPAPGRLGEQLAPTPADNICRISAA